MVGSLNGVLHQSEHSQKFDINDKGHYCKIDKNATFNTILCFRIL